LYITWEVNLGHQKKCPTLPQAGAEWDFVGAEWDNKLQIVDI